MKKFYLFFALLFGFVAQIGAQTNVSCPVAPKLNSVSDYTPLGNGQYNYTEQLSWTATSPINTYQIVVRDSMPTSTQVTVTTATVQGTHQYNTGMRAFNSNRKVSVAAFMTSTEVCTQKGEVTQRIANGGLITIVLDRTAPDANGGCKAGYTYVPTKDALVTLLDAALLSYRTTNPVAQVALTLNGITYKNGSFTLYDANKDGQASNITFPACVRLTTKIVY